MKNRTLGIGLILLSFLPALIFRSYGPAMLEDTDTKFLLYKINEYKDPLRWFTHDWPLENHFYRPISTLFFELDNRLHPGSANGFSLTNAILCGLCAILTGWMVTELRRSLLAGVAAAWLFAWWSIGAPWLNFVWVLPYLVCASLLLRIRKDWKLITVGVGSFFVLSLPLALPNNFSVQTLNWLPGRTATSMTVFTLIAVASYLRFCYQSGQRMTAPVPTSTDVPATRTTQLSGEPKSAWGWFALSVVSTVIALGAYEQAVMIPFVLFFLGVWVRMDRVQVRFGYQTVFWAILIGYIAFRVSIIPPQPSGYQQQQLRNGPGFAIELLRYLFPGGQSLYQALSSLSVGVLILVTSAFWSPIFDFFTNLFGWVSQKTDWKRPALLLAIATFAYLPMAFLNQFGHYHFWPYTFMTVFVMLMLEGFAKSWVSAVSPRVFQAPPRSDRAPGSLPRL